MIIVIVTMNVFLDKQTEVMQTLLSMIDGCNGPSIVGSLKIKERTKISLGTVLAN
jgi:hypothetical protein